LWFFRKAFSLPSNEDLYCLSTPFFSKKPLTNLFVFFRVNQFFKEKTGLYKKITKGGEYGQEDTFLSDPANADLRPGRDGAGLAGKDGGYG
jgi:hypothetical protein